MNPAFSVGEKATTMATTNTAQTMASGPHGTGISGRRDAYGTSSGAPAAGRSLREDCLRRFDIALHATSLLRAPATVLGPHDSWDRCPPTHRPAAQAGE